MAIKLFLNSQTIINHVFPVVGRNAYDATEVDKILDEVIQDYKQVEANSLVLKREYEDLVSKARRLEQEKRSLEVDLEKYKARFANIKPSENVTLDNIEYARRIGTLEKFLWAHGFNPDTIK